LRKSQPAALGYIAAAAIVVGSFGPLDSSDLWYNRSVVGYFGGLLDQLVFVGALLLAIAAFFRAHRSALLITLAITAILCLGFIEVLSFVIRSHEMEAADAAANRISWNTPGEFEWGWWPLLFGVTLAAVFSLRGIAIRRKTLASAKDGAGYSSAPRKIGFHDPRRTDRPD
jgi:hypothetical protein